MRGVFGLGWSEILALLAIIGYAGLLVTELSRRYAVSRVPLLLSAVAVLGLTVVGSAKVRDSGAFWALRDGPRGPLVVAALLALVITAVLARTHPRWRPAYLLGIAAYLVIATTWVPRVGWPGVVAHPGQELRACLTSGWLTSERGELKHDVIPNLALYLPLGIALALAMRRRIVAVAIIVATTGLTETYQALFTDRTCSRSDVLTNSIGGLVGAAAIVGVELARRRVPAAVS